ncbi:MAG: hypothetical protein Q9196_001505, partial [Gyalolechia fulgens]
MRFIEGSITALAILAFAAASPIELQPRSKDFIIHQSVRKPFIKSGPAAVLSVYGKYNATAPEDVIKAAAANDGTVSANPEQYDSQYLTPVTIGGQTLNLDFDTGSSDFGYTWQIQYGDGSSASGDVYTDTVQVGTTTVAGQAVELAQQISSSFQQNLDNDGLLGLAFDSINTVKPTQQKTFFSNAKASLSAPLFTANLKKGKPGSYTFGYVDAAQHTGSVTYVGVNTANGFWEFTSNGYAVGSGGFVSQSIDSIA